MQKLLFVELLGGLGDLLIALPTIQALGRAHPEAELTVLTRAPGGELLQHDPLIAHVAYIRKNTNTQKQLVRDSVAAFLNHDRSPFDLIVSDSDFDGIDTLIHESDTPRTVTNLWRKPPPATMRVVDRFLQILLEEGLIYPGDIAPLELHLTREEYNHALDLLGDFQRPLVLLFPDSDMEIKRWSSERFVELGQALQREYGTQVMVHTGAKPGEPSSIAASIGGTARALVSMGLRELAGVINYADLYVGTDTDSSQLAAAMGVPTITLFGPSWHERSGQPAPHINLQGYAECRERIISNFTLQPCWYSGQCPLGLWRTCVDAISPADVLAASAPFLKQYIRYPQSNGEGQPEEALSLHHMYLRRGR